MDRNNNKTPPQTRNKQTKKCYNTRFSFQRFSLDVICAFSMHIVLADASLMASLMFTRVRIYKPSPGRRGNHTQCPQLVSSLCITLYHEFPSGRSSNFSSFNKNIGYEDGASKPKTHPGKRQPQHAALVTHPAVLLCLPSVC